jgi:hypothetical protein
VKRKGSHERGRWKRKAQPVVSQAATCANSFVSADEDIFNRFALALVLSGHPRCWNTIHTATHQRRHASNTETSFHASCAPRARATHGLGDAPTARFSAEAFASTASAAMTSIRPASQNIYFFRSVSPNLINLKRRM